MAAKDDVSAKYTLPSKIDKATNVLFWANSVIAIIAILASGQFQDALFALQAISGLLYVVLDYFNDATCWYSAEKARRMHLIENAFDVDLIGASSEGYYNNRFDTPLSRWFVDSFESVFFSREIARRMRTVAIVKLVIAVIVFIFALMFIKNAALYPVLAQVIFSAYFIATAIRTCVYCSRLDELYEVYYRELITYGVHGEERVPTLIATSEEYECVKAHYKVHLSSRLHDKLNDELSACWQDMEKKISINL